jgi:hypothetical protein
MRCLPPVETFRPKLFHNEGNSVKINLLGRFQFLCRSAAVLFSLLVPVLAAGQVPVIQTSNSSGVIYQKSVSVSFPTAQNAGDLNVVVVDWFDISATVASVTDSNGNTYVLAAGTVATPLPAPGANQSGVSQAIYYAKNILAGANTVTVSFNQNTLGQDVHMVEYGTTPIGLDAVNPLDTSVGASATSSPADSGMATTNSANDLIFGAGDITTRYNSLVSSCGTGCTMSGVPAGAAGGINSYGNIVEDALVAAIGPYHAGATFTSGSGVMQMVALRESGQAPVVLPAPTATSVAPTSASEAGGTPIVITGTNFVQGATVVFTTVGPGGTVTASAVDCVVASATTINCLTPVFLVDTDAFLIVTNVDGQATAPLAFTPGFTAFGPFTTSGGAGSIFPAGGSTNGGAFVTISGSDFAAGATVTVGGLPFPANQVVVVNSNTIQAFLPAGSAGTATVTVTNPSGEAGTVPGGFTFSTGAGINFVQVNSTQQDSASTVTTAYNLAQTAGDLNAVVVGWNDTSATIKSVADTAGNTYTLAAPPTQQGTALTQAIYYAKNINAAPTNIVIVTFNNGPASFVDVRVLEYSGLDTFNPLDAAGGASGSGTALDSGAVTATSAGDLFLGASTVGSTIGAPGVGFATVILTPFGDNVEQFFPPAPGSYDATATLKAGAPWVMQGVAFRASTGIVPGFGLSSTALAPASIAAGGSATSTVTVTPSGGFTGTVTVTCTGLPTGGACVPLSLTPGASPAAGTLTITTTSATPAGTSTVTVSGMSGSVTKTTTVTLVVTAVPSFTLAAASPTPGTVSPGGSATSTITVTGTGGFTDTVTFSCSVAPQNAPAPVCSLGPASVSLTSTTASATATATVSTTAATAALRHSSSIFYALLLPIGGMTLLGVGFGSRRKKVLGLLLVFLMASGLLFLASCSSGSSSSGGGGGGGQSGTPAGTYTVTVTGTPTSGTAQTTTFTLTVN